MADFNFFAVGFGQKSPCRPRYFEVLLLGCGETKIESKFSERKTLALLLHSYFIYTSSST